MNAFRVMIIFKGQKMQCGSVAHTPDKGWRFQPHFQAQPSRRFWPTAEAALKGRVKNYTLEPY